MFRRYELRSAMGSYKRVNPPWVRPLPVHHMASFRLFTHDKRVKPPRVLFGEGSIIPATSTPVLAEDNRKNQCTFNETKPNSNTTNP